jgi:hypothetical protein
MLRKEAYLSKKKEAHVHNKKHVTSFLQIREIRNKKDVLVYFTIMFITKFFFINYNFSKGHANKIVSKEYFPSPPLIINVLLKIKFVSKYKFIFNFLDTFIINFPIITLFCIEILLWIRK